jgi:hypothetical protein
LKYNIVDIIINNENTTMNKILSFLAIFFSCMLLMCIIVETKVYVHNNHFKYYKNGIVTNHYEINNNHYCIRLSYIDKNNNENNCLLVDDHNNIEIYDLAKLEEKYSINTEIKITIPDTHFCEQFQYRTGIILYVGLIPSIYLILYFANALRERTIEKQIKNDLKYMNDIKKELFKLQNIKHGDNDDIDQKKNIVNDINKDYQINV